MKARVHLSLAIIAVAVLALSGAPPQAGASCTFGVSFKDAFYTHAETRKGVARGAGLNGGVRPGCDDTVVLGPDGQRLDEPEPDVPVVLQRVRGVSAKLAVSQPGVPGVYLAPGTFPQLPRHPLHKALHGARRMPDETKDRVCGPAYRVRGVLRVTPLAGGPLSLTTREGLDVTVLVDAGTRLRGARRVADQPVVAGGDDLTVTGRSCADAYEAPVVAQRIRVRPAG